MGITTARTLTGRIPGIDKDYQDPQHPSLVGNKSSQLVERPAMQIGTRGPSSPNPRADALKVLKDNRPFRALGRFYDLLANDVVYILGEALLLAAAFLQEALGRWGAFRLQFLSQPAVASAQVSDLSAGILPAVAIRGNVDHPKIGAVPLSRERRFMPQKRL